MHGRRVSVWRERGSVEAGRHCREQGMDVDHEDEVHLTIEK